MAATSLNRQRMVKKAAHWHWHGKHKPCDVTWRLHQERERLRPMREPMYASVREAFQANRRDR